MASAKGFIFPCGFLPMLHGYPPRLMEGGLYADERIRCNKPSRFVAAAIAVPQRTSPARTGPRCPMPAIAQGGQVVKVSRRQFVCAAPAAFVGASNLSACSRVSAPEGYEAVAASTWRIGTLPDLEGGALTQELVRCATLAPSSHNTQCWRFSVEEKAIAILPDLTRRCPAVDPDDHHMFVTLGCAAENLVQAALAHGLIATPDFDVTRDAVRVTLAPAAARTSPLFNAMASRQCTRGDYDGRKVSREDLTLLERAGTSNGVRMPLLTDRLAMERVLEHVVQANTAQLADAAFVRELKSWIRFNGTDAVRTRDGLFSVSTGNPAIPAWLGELAFGWFFTTKGENDKIARQVRNSAGIAVFVGESADKAHWVNVGRAYERFALQATALGIRNAFLNQAVEVAAVRSTFAAALGLSGRRPDLVVRFGRGPTLPQSLRRPVESVMV